MAIPRKEELVGWQRLLHDIRAVIPPTDHWWATQAPQYPQRDAPDVLVEFNPTDWVRCLLAYDAEGTLVGILNYYPDGVRLNHHWAQEPGSCLVVVRPDRQRQGIGSRLLREALARWEIPLFMQRYTPEGLLLARHVVDELVEASKEATDDAGSGTTPGEDPAPERPGGVPGE